MIEVEQEILLTLNMLGVMGIKTSKIQVLFSDLFVVRVVKGLYVEWVVVFASVNESDIIFLVHHM